MELLELLKLLNSQGQQAQVETLREAIVLLNSNNATLNFRINCTFWILFVMICATLTMVVVLYEKLDKRLKKIELANGLKVS